MYCHGPSFRPPHLQGILLETEKEELAHIVESRLRRLDATGPTWEVPMPADIVRALPLVSAAQPAELDALLRRGQLRRACLACSAGGAWGGLRKACKTAHLDESCLDPRKATIATLTCMPVCLSNIPH